MDTRQALYVGVGHKARHGKDQAVKYILAEYGDKYDIRRYAFGDELKLEFYDALLTPLHPFWGMAGDYLKLPHPRGTTFDLEKTKLAWIEEHKSEIVHLLQPYGTEFRRGQDPFYWVRQFRKRVERDRPQIALIPDLRFYNEYLFIKAYKGYVADVQCFLVQDGKEVPYVDSSREPNHPSETELDGKQFDYTIRVERGKLEELKADALWVMQDIIDKQHPLTEEGKPVPFEGVCC